MYCIFQINTALVRIRDFKKSFLAQNFGQKSNKHTHLFTHIINIIIHYFVEKSSILIKWTCIQVLTQLNKVQLCNSLAVAITHVTRNHQLSLKMNNCLHVTVWVTLRNVQLMNSSQDQSVSRQWHQSFSRESRRAERVHALTLCDSSLMKG